MRGLLQKLAERADPALANKREEPAETLRVGVGTDHGRSGSRNRGHAHYVERAVRPPQGCRPLGVAQANWKRLLQLLPVASLGAAVEPTGKIDRAGLLLAEADQELETLLELSFDGCATPVREPSVVCRAEQRTNPKLMSRRPNEAPTLRVKDQDRGADEDGRVDAGVPKLLDQLLIERKGINQGQPDADPFRNRPATSL